MERIGFLNVFIALFVSFFVEAKKYVVDLASCFDVFAFIRERKVLGILRQNLVGVVGVLGEVVCEKKRGDVSYFLVFDDDFPIFLGTLNYFLSKDFSMEAFLATIMSRVKKCYVTTYQSKHFGAYDCSKNLIFGNPKFAYSNLKHDAELEPFCDDNGVSGEFFSSDYSSTSSTICFSNKIEDYKECVPIIQEYLERLDAVSKEISVFFNMSRKDLYIEVFVCDVKKYRIKDIDGTSKDISLLIDNNSATKKSVFSLVELVKEECEFAKFGRIS